MRGSDVTFDELVRDRGAAWLRLAYLLTGDRHLAEDLLQTALVQVFRRWSSAGRAAEPDAYVRRVLVNTLITWRRRRAWWERPTASGALPEGAARAGDSGPTGAAGATDAVDVADDLAARDALWRLLERLAPRARAVLVLRFYEDLDDVTIAAVLGVAPGTVRATASRALATLRTELAVTGTGGAR